MSTNYDFTFWYKKRVTGFFFVFVLSLLTASGYAQVEPFTADSVPLVNDQVVFTSHFTNDLSKEEFRTKAYIYLGTGLDPYSASFLANTPDSVVCRVVDYLEIESSLLSVFGMYMIYDLKLVYHEKSSDLTINNITFMEKSDFERKVEKPRESNFPGYTGKEMMIDKIYSPLLRKNASARVTDAAIERVNEVVNGLAFHFSE